MKHIQYLAGGVDGAPFMQEGGTMARRCTVWAFMATPSVQQAVVLRGATAEGVVREGACGWGPDASYADCYALALVLFAYAVSGHAITYSREDLAAYTKFIQTWEAGVWLLPVVFVREWLVERQCM